VSGSNWALDQESEATLDNCVAGLDEATEKTVRGWVAAILRDPQGREPDRPNLWSMQVPGTEITLAWTLDTDKGVVVLVMCG
jgi:hypothetical protein